MPVRHGGSYTRPAPQPDPSAQIVEGVALSGEPPVDDSAAVPASNPDGDSTDAPSSRLRRGASIKD